MALFGVSEEQVQEGLSALAQKIVLVETTHRKDISTLTETIISLKNEMKDTKAQEEIFASLSSRIDENKEVIDIVRKDVLKLIELMNKIIKAKKLEEEPKPKTPEEEFQDMLKEKKKESIESLENQPKKELGFTENEDEGYCFMCQKNRKIENFVVEGKLVKGTCSSCGTKVVKRLR
jgi:hypothetical protein